MLHHLRSYISRVKLTPTFYEHLKNNGSSLKNLRYLCTDRNGGSSSCDIETKHILYSKVFDVQSCEKIVLKSHQYSVQLSSATSLQRGQMKFSLLSPEKSALLLSDQIEIWFKSTQENEVCIESKKIDNVNDKSIVQLEITQDENVELHLFNGCSLSLNQLEARNLVANIDESGTFTSKNVKCQQLTVYSKDGDINCDGYLIGNVCLIGDKSSSVKVKRLQGNELQVKSSKGTINIKAIYSKVCNISAKLGNVHLSNVHGKCQVDIQSGNLKIAGMDGQLQVLVARGNADVHISCLKSASENVIVATEGDVTLRLSPQMTAAIRLEGKDVHMDEDVSCEGQISTGDEQHVIYQGIVNNSELYRNPLVVGIATQGKVYFGVQSWLSAFKEF